jgi:hypothetical protein
VKVINVETARIEAQFSYNLGNNRQVAFLLKESQQAAPSADSVQEQATPKSSQTAKVYKVGDTGPAGGIVFYDKGNNSGGWRYLEAAPAETEKQTFWCSEIFPWKDIEGVRDVGRGKTNTEFIMRTVRARGGFDWAAEVCTSLVVNGYNDWFLPSRDELHMMYGNLQRRGLGGFKNDWYWSSTIFNSDCIVSENLTDGSQDARNYGPGNFFQKKYVRAVRQF